MPWITPDDAPGEAVCYKVWLPSGTFYEACAVGAFLDLARPENWERVNGQSPEIVAAAFDVTWEKSIWWERCCMIGMVFWWPVITPPDNALMCNGGLYNAADYPDLYALIGTKFGGSTGVNFRVPSLGERFIYGTEDDEIGEVGGEENHTLTIGEMPSHSHRLDATIVPSDPVGVEPTLGYSAVSLLQTRSEGGGNSHNNMPPYFKLVPCIIAK